jgi:AraC family transcriptional regulator
MTERPLMDHLQQIQRAVDYIEDHLHGDLSVGAIAKVAGFSRWHFQMVFSSAVGDTLKEYVRKRRLSAALSTLRDTDQRILDIALDAGFESQEAFTRAFKAMFGKTPGDCRKDENRSVMALQKPRITMAYLDHLYGGINMQPVIKHVDEKKVVGMGASFISVLSPEANNQKVIGELWGQYNPRGPEIKARLSWADIGVITCLGGESEKSHPNEMFYVAGTEVKSTEEIPAGMVALTIPAGTYAVFTHKGKIQKIDMTMKYIYGSWLPKSGKKLREAPELEIYDQRFKHDSDDSELDIYIPIQ